MTTIPPELKRVVKTNKLVVFAGSGTSRDCGFPDWKTLVTEVLNDLEKDEPSYQYFRLLLDDDKITPLQVLNILEEKGKRRQIVSFIGKRFRPPNLVNLELQKKLIELTPKVITTNYDRCFELAWGAGAPLVPNDDEFSLCKLRDDSEYLFKIHGDIDAPGKCVLFADQYKTLYERESFWIGLMNLLMNSTVLFVGFSLTDPYVNELLVRIKKMDAGFTNKHYIITTDKNFSVRELGESIVPIVIDDYKNLGQLITSLIPSVNNLPTRRYARLIGREAEIATMMKYLMDNPSAIIVEGVAGVGKTSLVLETAYACLRQSDLELNNITRFNNAVWINGSEFKEGTNALNAIFDIIGRVFNSERVTRIAADDLWKKDWEVHKLLQENKTLIIIKNFAQRHNGEDITRWVQRIPESCKVILTTTESLSLPGNHLPLAPLRREEAMVLMQGHITQDHLPAAFSASDMSVLIEHTKTSPRAIELAAAQLEKGKINVNAVMKSESVLDYFHNDVWNSLSKDAHGMLLLFSVFEIQNSLSKEALTVLCKRMNFNYEKGARECVSCRFLAQDGNDRLAIDPHSKDFICRQLDGVAKKMLKKHWSDYFLHFIKKNVEREQPDERYWNALVSDKMKALTPEWGCISDVLYWAKEDEESKQLLVDLVCLLVHYMDSRFYNQHRVTFVEAALQAARSLGLVYEEALFQIDALGWTYVEESLFDKARETILAGIKKAEELSATDEEKADDLAALGNGWLARVEIERGNSAAAFDAISKALTFKAKPWIQYRVYMAAGDVHVREDRFAEALEYYEMAKEKYDLYDGEGHDYQINPRRGMALWANNRVKDAIDIMENQMNHDLPIASLYAEYGLALINRAVQNPEEANRKLNALEKDICARTSSFVLLNLMRSFREDSSMKAETQRREPEPVL